MTELPDHTLMRAELRTLVAELAANPQRWRHAVHHDAEQRIFAEIARNEHVSAWLICWMPGQDTGFHDHDLSSGAVTVIEGAVREDRLTLSSDPSGGAIYAAGETFDFCPSDIHRVSHEGDQPTVTLHVYSPPLARMGAYVVEPSGALQRHPVGEDVELRPLAA
jgi:predicted metal-dependent enzyme (double-stranded beta helix superfamily)